MKALVFLVAIGLSLVTAGADYLIKKASGENQGIASWRLAFGALIYAMTAFGWFYVFKRMEISNAGVVYSLSVIIFLVLTGVIFFKETVSVAEIFGIAMAICSIFLLYRFS